MEEVYNDTLGGAKVSVGEARAASRNIVVAHISSFEFTIPVIGILLLIHTSGSVLAFGAEFGDLRKFYAISASLTGILIPVVLFLLLLPLNILLSIRYSTLAIGNIVLSAYLMSSIYTFLLPPEAARQFGAVILPLLLSYGFGIFVVATRLSNLVCFTAYQNRHKKGGINSYLPLQKRGELVSMSAQDHYVELATEAGTHLNRMTMKEAVGLVSEEKGMQVHRSHWVAYSAMHTVEKTQDRVFLVLRSGKKVPVSKPKLAQVQAYLDSR